MVISSLSETSGETAANAMIGVKINAKHIQSVIAIFIIDLFFILRNSFLINIVSKI